MLSQADHPTMMVDFGPTALKKLNSLGHDHRDIEVICFTHLHGDHIGGFPFWVLDSTYNRVRTRRMRIVGPVGVEARLMQLLRVCFGDVADQARPFDLEFTELRPEEELQLDAWTIRGFAADHMDPPEVPLCLQIESSSSSSVSFSGDTQFCNGLFEAAKGADMLVCECSSMRPPAGKHCTWEEWTKNFHRLDCPRLVLTHLNEEMRASTATLKGPDGLDLQFADDGMIFDI
jgi:ribonuclease BN (tRNA processing enzyme)